MKDKLDYKKIYIEIVGEKSYEQLINNISNKVIKQYNMDMPLDTFMKIVEVNIKAILIIGISKYIGLDDNSIKKKLHLGINKYILEGDYNKFLKEYSKEINKLVRNLKNLNLDN